MAEGSVQNLITKVRKCRRNRKVTKGTFPRFSLKKWLADKRQAKLSSGAGSMRGRIHDLERDMRKSAIAFKKQDISRIGVKRLSGYFSRLVTTARNALKA